MAFAGTDENSFSLQVAIPKSSSQQNSFPLQVAIPTSSFQETKPIESLTSISTRDVQIFNSRQTSFRGDFPLYGPNPCYQQTRTRTVISNRDMRLEQSNTYLTTPMQDTGDTMGDIGRLLKSVGLIHPDRNRRVVQGQLMVTGSSHNGSMCMDCGYKLADAIIYDCGHTCLCYCCGINYRQSKSPCPICHEPVKDVIIPQKP